jgi:nitroreductase
MNPATPELADGWRRIVGGRRSCRGFTAAELPEELLLEVFTLAQRTASWCNAQPWTVALVSGQARLRLAKSLDAAYGSRSPVWDIEPPVNYLGVHQERRQAAGALLYRATGVPRQDMVGRVEQMRRNFAFFGAPHVAVITVAEDLGAYALVDVGAYLATVLWTAEALGVAAIAQAAPARHSDLLRDVLAIAPGQRVVGCIALGNADPAHPANQFRTDRAEPDEVLRVHVV